MPSAPQMRNSFPRPGYSRAYSARAGPECSRTAGRRRWSHARGSPAASFGRGRHRARPGTFRRARCERRAGRGTTFAPRRRLRRARRRCSSSSGEPAARSPRRTLRPPRHHLHIR